MKYKELVAVPKKLMKNVYLIQLSSFIEFMTKDERYDKSYDVVK